jgi:hypothetical protein
MIEDTLLHSSSRYCTRDYRKILWAAERGDFRLETLLRIRVPQVRPTKAQHAPQLESSLTRSHVKKVETHPS